MRSHVRHDLVIVAAVLLVTSALTAGAIALRVSRTGDGFDFLRWEVATLPNKWLYAAGAPFREELPEEEALVRYFALTDRDSEEGRRLENRVEAIIEGRVDAVLRELGLTWALSPFGVWPPVDGELAGSPRVLVVSPRNRIARVESNTLRPDLNTAEAETIERAIESDHPDRSALVVGTGGLSLFPAVISNRDGYEDTVETVAHEWAHHYLSVFPLGRDYFRSDEVRTINETVADMVGIEVARIVVERWPLPRPAATPTPIPAATPTPAATTQAASVDLDATMRELRTEVDALLAADRIDDAERRMDEVRRFLADNGIRVRRINQAYFAWYGTYAARGDSVDPLGGQLRTLREELGSLHRFLTLMRDATSRDEVAALLASHEH